MLIIAYYFSCTLKRHKNYVLLGSEIIGVQEGSEVGADIWSISIKNKWGLEIVDSNRVGSFTES